MANNDQDSALDNTLKALFHQQKNTDQQPNPDAKQRAIDAALREFDAVTEQQQKKNSNLIQGLFAWLRLMGTNAKKLEDEKMKKLSQPWAMGGMATAVVAVFGVLLVNYEPRNIDEPEYLPSVPVKLNLPVAKELKELDAAPAPAPAKEELVVTGFRKSLARSVEEKREASHIVDTIEAEDIGSSTDQGMAQALESVTGVSVASQTGEGTKIAVRGSAAPQAEISLSGVKPQRSSLEKKAGFSSFSEDIKGIQDRFEERNKFERIETNPIKLVSESPVSTFSIDVDTASYSFVRSALNEGRLPPKDAVRIEEMLNYFDYNYPLPESRQQPFKTSVNVVDAPWASGKKLMHIGIKGYDLSDSEQPRSNLVFLLDVSGSMNQANKLPLVKQSMNMLLSKLQADDTVSIVVYAGAAGTVLEPTPVKEKTKIIDALSRLSAGGSTAGGQGIELAYQMAEANFDKNAVNRVILATDGDFNVGITGREALKGFIERKRDKGIFLSVLGFGRGNYNDHLMQSLAQNGNGVAAYIDSLNEAQKVLVDEATSTLFPIAKDVKIQVEFNPATVAEYRLIGYETRALKREDFNNDKVDAGDIGAGHTVTAIYEITPEGSAAQSTDALRYKKKQKAVESSSNEYAFLKVRYKLPTESASKLITTPIASSNTELSAAMQQEVEFGIAVSGFAQLLKDPTRLSNWSYDNALTLAQENRGEDAFGYRAELVQLIRKAQVAKEL